MKQRVVLATDNPGKLKEFSHILADLYELVPQSCFNLKTPPETGHSFEENALIKARHACNATGMPAIADDSGLEVTALGGAPGIFSARYAGAHASAGDNINKLINATADFDDDALGARFYCAIAHVTSVAGTSVIVSATWTGTLLRTPRGDKGFGYDPIFHVAEYNCTAAELEPAIKNKISHRGQALREICNLLSRS